MPKLNFSGNLPNTIRNNILKLPVIPAGLEPSPLFKMAAKMLTRLYRRVDIPNQPLKI